MLLLKQHPLSAAYPPMPANELADLRASIETNGLILSLVTLDDMILDGWHRYKCCIELGIEPRTKPLSDDTDPVDFVRAMNGARRHMNASQRAMAEVSINEWAKRGHQKESALSADSARTASPEAPTAVPATAAKMAEAANVSTRIIEQAKAVVERAAPAVVDAVKAGEISVGRAAKALPQKPASPAPSSDYDAALARIAKVCGKQEADAIRESGAVPLKAREAILWAKQEDAKMREVCRLVIGQHWLPSRALRLIDRMVDEQTRISEIISLCIAANGAWEATVAGHIISVTKRGGYK